MTPNELDNPKSDREKFEQEYDDNFWRFVLYKYAQTEGEKLLKEAEEAKNDPQYAPSPEAKARFYDMLNDYFRNKNKE